MINLKQSSAVPRFLHAKIEHEGMIIELGTLGVDEIIELRDHLQTVVGDLDAHILRWGTVGPSE